MVFVVMDKKEIKKRGRKPKGGKIIENTMIVESQTGIVQNVILHLKCSIAELSKSLNCVIEPYTHAKCHGEIIQENNDIPVSQKLKNLTVKLHTNDINMTRTDCFWCTCSYETPIVHIPKCKIDGIYQVYGSFCCPECASAYLFKENLDDSTKFERYHLLNYLYGSVYNYEKNFIPAPSPHYMLTKYGGTLTINEFRESLRLDKMIMIINKPICSIYPELIQSMNESNVPSLKSIKVNEPNYKLCRKQK